MKIKRIVKLTFQSDKVDSFLTIFAESKHKIRQTEGCNHLELWRSTQNPDILFTYSYWDSEAALNQYRQSDLFQATWKKTKALFADKPQAWSIEHIDSADNQEKT